MIVFFLLVFAQKKVQSITLGSAYKEFAYNEYPAITSNVQC